MSDEGTVTAAHVRMAARTIYVQRGLAYANAGELVKELLTRIVRRPSPELLAQRRLR